MPRLARSRHHQRDVVRVHLPLLRPALGAAALLVLRGFDTLATQVFTLASLYRYEEAGLSALIIVVVSLAPVLLLHGVIVAGRPRLCKRLGYFLTDPGRLPAIFTRFAWTPPRSAAITEAYPGQGAKEHEPWARCVSNHCFRAC